MDPIPFHQTCSKVAPHLALVLGSGMGSVVERWGRIASLPYSSTKQSHVHGHLGQYSLVKVHEVPLLVLEGRCHYYEGYTWDQVVEPTHFAASVGVRAILHTNAAGGIRDDLPPGTLMAITDHLNCTYPSWWMSPRLLSPYSPRLLSFLDEAAKEINLTLKRGVYAALTGPCYETPAEIRALRSWEADAVGMSTVREVLAGVECGIECAALSCITNRAAGLSDSPLSHDEVLAVGKAQTERLALLVESFVNATSRRQGK